MNIRTLVCLIVVQDILIIFEQFSSQDILIRSRTLINFREIFQQDKCSRYFFNKYALITILLSLIFKIDTTKFEKMSPQDDY